MNPSGRDDAPRPAQQPRLPQGMHDGTDAASDSAPSARLVAAFTAAAARMLGLGFVNPALAVEAVDFAPWGPHWLGVMVTPWFIGLTLVPRDRAAWPPLRVGTKRRYRFPAGDFEFIGALDAIAGEYQSCSLFSPVLEFKDQATARLVARYARAALFDPANADRPHAPLGDPAAAPAAEGAGSIAAIEDAMRAPLSRRAFVRGPFLRGTREDDRG